MAVQAQYPSNILLFNRNGQDLKNALGGDFPLQPQQSGYFDQSHMFFNNGAGANPRKRGREVLGSAAAAATAAAPINLFSLQSQPPPSTLINLAQFHNQQPNVVSTGLRLAFGDQQQQNIVLPSSNLSSLLSEDLTAQIKQQRDELDQFLQAQGEQLRRTLAVTRQRHYHTLLGAAEESAGRRLREKDAEMEKAARQNAELEARVAQLRAEAQVWQAKARVQEVTAVSLQTQLQQAMTSRGGAHDMREEGGGFAVGGDTYAEDAESAYIDPERVVSSGPMCKGCRKRAASVVLLPCRHLCLCTDCDAAVEACPLCLSFRSASVEVYFS
ncbi:hypothetical protein HHK36_028118 [Tetracentron sinense]|uniref:RING-type domain-containing protein n=1 Tax=Tetracentron sinense TaxID=13715 RepID=A0A834YG08_TETSI|nr:hypothetical protein HHK36_028118 [Tetracentron sinense]